MGEITFEVNGVEETIQDLENIFGKSALSRKIDKGLNAGAKVIKRELENNFEGFKKTGASKDEISISEPMDLQGVRTIKIYWNGPKNRYRIIHLNEFGTVKNPNPRGKGAVENAIRAGQEEFFRVVEDSILDDL